MSLQKWLDGRAHVPLRSKRDPSAARQTMKAMKSQSTEPATRDGDGYLAAGRSCALLRDRSSFVTAGGIVGAACMHETMSETATEPTIRMKDLRRAAVGSRARTVTTMLAGYGRGWRRRCARRGCYCIGGEEGIFVAPIESSEASLGAAAREELLPMRARALRGKETKALRDPEHRDYGGGRDRTPRARNRPF
jgi:hypothetical protein